LVRDNGWDAGTVLKIVEEEIAIKHANRPTHVGIRHVMYFDQGEGFTPGVRNRSGKGKKNRRAFL